MTCSELLEMLGDEGIYSCSTLTEFLDDWAKKSTPVPYHWLGPYLHPDSCGVALLFCDDGILDIPWKELLPDEGYEQLELEDARIHVDPKSMEFPAMIAAVGDEIQRLGNLRRDILDTCARLGRAEEVSDSG